MTRVSRIALIALAPMLLAQPAAAQDCFCGASPFAGAGAFAVAAAPDPVPDMAPETPDTTIESVVMLPEAEVPAQPAAPGVLWCTGGSDPRCMPMHASDTPEFHALSSSPVANVVTLARPRLRRTVTEPSSWTPVEGLAPARGVQASIERPPRG
jgi:hypothetical protein